MDERRIQYHKFYTKKVSLEAELLAVQECLRSCCDHDCGYTKVNDKQYQIEGKSYDAYACVVCGMECVTKFKDINIERLTSKDREKYLVFV